MARGVAAELMTPGSHGTTFGGNPLETRAALAVLDVMESGDLVAQAAQRGQQLLDGFREQLANEPGIASIRGRGMMIGIELDRPCGELVGRAIDRGLLINVTAGRVVRLLPPLITSENQAEMIVDKVSGLIREFLAEQDA